MNGPRIGELCAGYGGLGMGIQQAIGGEVAWVSDVDKGANKILAHRFPGVPNIGDMTAVDWVSVEPVDVLAGGTPCQDLSHAGKRAGMTEGTRSNLWVAMREAIAQLRPGLVVWENVRGAYSAAADSELEPCAGCVGDGSGVHLRALGRVLGDLSDLGYVGGWHGLRAADVGAPHGRFRVFVVAYPVSSGLDGWAPIAQRGAIQGVATARCGEVAALLPTPRIGGLGDNASERRRNSPGLEAVVGKLAEGGDALVSNRGAQGVLPIIDGEEVAQVGNGFGAEVDVHAAGLPPKSTADIALLPTPAVNDMGEGKTVEAWDEWTAKMKAAHGHGPSLSIEAQRLLPTPRAGDGEKGGPNQRGSSGDLMLPSAAVKLLPTPTTTQRGTDCSLDSREGAQANLHNEVATMPQDWGQYADAIHRWEALTRPAPPPTELGPKGSPRLSAAFSEWMMGLPAGWVTDVPGITRNEALKAIGNGVVPAQAEAALRFLLAHLQVEAVA